MAGQVKPSLHRQRAELQIARKATENAKDVL
jgi:hypothetical protein